MLIDTHCHIHESDFLLPLDEVMDRAHAASVGKIICVGTDEDSSRRAIALAEAREDTYAVIGVHPHNAKDGYDFIADLANTSKKIVGIGEIGLDYYYNHSSREEQIKALEFQIDVALKHDLPIAFHVRDAFDDFWPVFNNFSGTRGELHSFTDSKANLDIALSEGLFIGVNGISTFTRDASQQETFDSIPLGSLLLETDAPFLTPHPFRGTINEPAHVRIVAEYHASRRGLTLEDVASATTKNAQKLYALS